jgi:hypothetical protein
MANHCKACDTRTARGLEGACPACANERTRAMNAEPIEPVVGCMTHDKCRVATAESDAAKARVHAYEEPRKLTPEEIAERERGYVGPVMPRTVREHIATHGNPERMLIMCVDVSRLTPQEFQKLRDRVERAVLYTDCGLPYTIAEE